MGEKGTGLNDPFKFVLDACHNGTMAEKLLNPLPFPRMVDMELCNVCNFKCKMCPIGQGVVKRKKGFMTGNVFYKILNELAEYKTPVRFIRWGEPTLHPELYHWIKKVKEKGLLCHINTNGFLLDADRICETGLDSIKFSFQGGNKVEYEIWRGIDYYDELCRKIKFLSTLPNRPFIIAGTTLTENENNFFVIPGADRMWIGRTKDLTRRPEEYGECPEVFDKLSVNFDGTVSACCSDFDNEMLIGDTEEQTLKEIWEGEKLDYYRRELADYRHSELPRCKFCSR